MSSEGAIGISDGDRYYSKFNHLEIPNSSIHFSNLDPPRIQLEQINHRSFLIYNSAEGAPCISTK